MHVCVEVEACSVAGGMPAKVSLKSRTLIDNVFCWLIEIARKCLMVRVAFYPRRLDVLLVFTCWSSECLCICRQLAEKWRACPQSST